VQRTLIPSELHLGANEVRRTSMGPTMSEDNQTVTSTSNIIAAFIFYFVFILLLPVFALGYVIWIVGALAAGRNSGVSGTAQGPLTARWFQHRLGTRKDAPANRLMMVLPGVPPLGLRSWRGLP
jgi:hypothetical protein